VPLGRFRDAVGPIAKLSKLPASLGLENARKRILERFSGVFCVGLSLTCEDFVGHVAHSLVFVHELPFPLRRALLPCPLRLVAHLLARIIQTHHLLMGELN
jgi:hypothetical protein